MAGIYHTLHPGKRLIPFLYSAFHFMHPSHKKFFILAFVLQEGFIRVENIISTKKVFLYHGTESMVNR
jgi:ABC-type nickel/cobalt efflux system permease component RcnA